MLVHGINSARDSEFMMIPIDEDNSDVRLLMVIDPTIVSIGFKVTRDFRGNTPSKRTRHV